MIDWAGCHLKVFSSDLAWTWWKMIDLPFLFLWWKSWKFYFCIYSPNDACKCAINLFPSAESHLKMLIYCIFWFWMQIWNGCNALYVAENPIKWYQWKTHISEFRIKTWKEINPPWLWHLVEFLEMLLLHVISNDACKFVTNLFPISWEPFENVNLLYVERWLTPPSEWPGCQLKFFSSHLGWTWWMMIQLPPSSDTWWKSWKFHFCMYSPMMHVNLPQPFSLSTESHLKILNYCIFSCKCRFEMAAIHVILQETP